MNQRLLIITAVKKEHDAIGPLEGADIVVAGIGRVNAACATVETVLRSGPFDAIISAGIAGALPGAKAVIGDSIAASESVYFEEGLITPEGFADAKGLGFPLGDFEGNAVCADASLLEAARGMAEAFDHIARIATVATCSGTDAAAREVARRTGAIAEAMEGAAVLHAAARLKIPAIELRTISNTTGDRDRQTWDLNRALERLGEVVRAYVGRRSQS